MLVFFGGKCFTCLLKRFFFMLNVSSSANSQVASPLERTARWIHQNSTVSKAVRVAALVLGIGAIVAFPLLAPLCGAGVAVVSATSGALLTLVSALALAMLDLLIPPHHKMSDHMYTPAVCEGGELYYEGDVPILSLSSSDPFVTGKAQGYLCGAAISLLAKRFDFVLHTLARQPRAHELPNTLAKVREFIPENYVLEMEGLVDGYNQWAQEQPNFSRPKCLTLDDALLFHLMPDSRHFTPAAYEGLRSAALGQAVACSSLVDQNEEGELVFARNMDWPSFGLAGSYSLIIHRKDSSTIGVSVPGFIGVLTGMNRFGLSLAMNVCSGETTEIEGMPAAFYNRMCLERCLTVKDVVQLSCVNRPLGPYHLTVADGDQACSIHFFQSQQNPLESVIRYWKKEQPLSTFNYCYDSHGTSNDLHCSKERTHAAASFFRDRSRQPLEEALALPFIDNWITTHRVVMEPERRKFRVAFDNAFAGSAPLHEVPSRHLFGLDDHHF